MVYLGAEAARAARAVEHFEEHPGQKAEAEHAVNVLEQRCSFEIRADREASRLPALSRR